MSPAPPGLALALDLDHDLDLLMRIAILGAGGVGGYMGGVLARAGHDVRVLARADHLETIRSAGLQIRTPDHGFTVEVAATDDAAELGACDAAIVAVKSYSLADIAPAAGALAADGATIVPLLNGVDIVDRLAELGVPRPSLLAGLTYISAARVAPGVVERKSDFQRLTVGEPGGGASDRAGAFAAAFGDTPVEARAVDDIQVHLWRKFVFIASISAACGLARSAIGPIRDAPLGPALLHRAVEEVVAVARARGVELRQDETHRVLERINALVPHLEPSFLLDVKAGGPTELDILSAAVSSLGRDAGVETPVHDAATAALAAATS